jgi:tetratricopeptide (TPR) repeat protein
MGLVDDETGLVYFINAEHPWVVLYRGGKASFIEDDMLFRKLGTTGVEGHMQVRTFEMKPDDVLLLGSDGRDDILLGERADGQRIINEDEQEFLRRVEEGGGMLKDIEAGILRMGKLTDDFTLLRIGYREDAPYRENRISDVFQGYLQAGRKAFHEGELERAIEQYEAALSAHTDHPDALSELGQIYFKAKDYKRAAELLERYTDQNPADGEYMYLVSFSFKQLKKLKRAADFGERYRLRNPDNIKNLVNLADIYRLQDNSERAEMLLALALELDPNYKNAHRLQEALRKAG